MGLLYGENCVILASTVFGWSTRVTDSQTDGRTDRQTELPWHIRAIACMLSRVKQSQGKCKKMDWRRQKTRESKQGSKKKGMEKKIRRMGLRPQTRIPGYITAECWEEQLNVIIKLSVSTSFINNLPRPQMCNKVVVARRLVVISGFVLVWITEDVKFCWSVEASFDFTVSLPLCTTSNRRLQFTCSRIRDSNKRPGLVQK